MGHALLRLEDVKNKTLVIAAGGTFESFYNPEEGTPGDVPSLATTCILKALDKLGLGDECIPYALFAGDSKGLNDGHRDEIVNLIERLGAKRVVIVQGTDTMARLESWSADDPKAPAISTPGTGRYLKAKLVERGLKDVAVRITGAMYPLRDKNLNLRGLDADGNPMLEAPMCDGWRNLKLAVEGVRDAKPGVFIEMGEGPWDPSRMRKRRVTKKGPDGREMVVDSAFEPDVSRGHIDAIRVSKTRPQLVVLTADDSTHTQRFLPKLQRIEDAFRGKLDVVRLKGINKPRADNSEDMKLNLAYLGYHREPGDGGFDGHFPSGCVYKDGREVYRLPSDTQLADRIQPQTLADAIKKATGIDYDKQVLLARGEHKRGKKE